MPYVHLVLCGPTLDPTAVRRLSAGLTGLMAEILRKRPEVTAVRVETVDGGGWSVGGWPVSPAAHLEATITAGTNSAEEKARFIAAAAVLVKETVGPGLPVATYAVVREVPADAWGYDGVTQAARAAAASETARAAASETAPTAATPG